MSDSASASASASASSSSDASSSSAAVATSSDAAAASSSLASQISSSIAAAVSSSVIAAPDSTTTIEPTSTNVITSIISASAAAPTTNIITSVITQSATSNGITDTNPVTVVVTSVNTNPVSTTIIPVSASSRASSAAASSSSAAAINSGSGSNTNDAKSGGLSTAGKTAIAVVIPVAFVALLVAFGIWFWRKRKQRKDNQEQRRKEIDEYGYNPNNDPTLPSVAGESGAPQMAEDSHSGYRGWGAAAVGSNRKASTTISGGHTQGQLSDAGNSYGGPGSPNAGASYSDGHSGDPLVHQRDTMNSDELGALGAAPAAANNPGIRRGPSNASSAYSAGGRSEASDEPVPHLPSGQGQYDINPTTGYGYSQHGPYGDGSYGGGQDGAMPIVRDVSARRNTRIQQGGSYQQGNSGIAQNF